VFKHQPITAVEMEQ